jgi:predicted nucleotidyltransferase
MLPLIEQHRAVIQELCAKHGVKRLELFGSAARGDFNPAASDLDFFVEFTELGWKGSFKRYIGLKLDLEEKLGRPVDLVELSSVKNPYFVEVATRHRQLLYAA